MLRREPSLERSQIVELDTFQDNLCHWLCIAVYQGVLTDRTTSAARELAKSFFKHRTPPNDVPRTSLNELDKVKGHINQASQKLTTLKDALKHAHKEDQLSIAKQRGRISTGSLWEHVLQQTPSFSISDSLASARRASWIVRAPVEGYRPKLKTIFQYHECWRHECHKNRARRKRKRNFKKR